MSSYVGKVLERLVNDRLVWMAEKEKWIGKNQNGFRKGRSCTDTLVRLIADLEISRDLNINTVVVFLDVNTGYDNVRTNVICDILNDKQCPEKIVRYIDVWMKNRNTSFSIGDEIVENRLVNKGLPQEGVLSSTLYNIYTSGLTKDMDSEVNVIQYADDIALYIMKNNLNKCKTRVERATFLIEQRLNY